MQTLDIGTTMAARRCDGPTCTILERKVEPQWRTCFYITVPTDHPRPPVQTFDGARTQEVQLSSSVCQGLEAVCQDADVTLYGGCFCWLHLR